MNDPMPSAPLTTQSAIWSLRSLTLIAIALSGYLSWSIWQSAPIAGCTGGLLDLSGAAEVALKGSVTNRKNALYEIIHTEPKSCPHGPLGIWCHNHIRQFSSAIAQKGHHVGIMKVTGRAVRSTTG